MTNINLTEKEIALLTTFGNLVDEDTAEAQLESGPVFASADELSRYAEMEPKSVKSVANSLIKKGMVTGTADQYEMTEAAVRWVYDRRPAEDEAVEAAPAVPDVEGIVLALHAALKEDGATKCSALRAVAKGCEAPRAIFIQAAEAVGINRGTAARQWQEGRADETAPSPASEEAKEAALAYLMTLAPDEAFSIVLEHLSAKALKEIASQGK